MDHHDYGLEGADNTEGTQALKSYFAQHPGYQPDQPPRRLPLHYTYTAQAPDDQEDTLRSLGGLFGTTFGLVLGIAAVALVILHFWYGPPF